MLSKNLVSGDHVLDDTTGKAKVVYDIIHMIDELEYLVLFTDNTYVEVSENFMWKVFK